MKTDRSKKTTRRRYLVTLWTHPDIDQTLVLPGTIGQTRADARDHMIGTFHGSHRKKLNGREEYWSNDELKCLSEFEG